MRKKLTKKIRFEVFKRDSFKCQYCGESAPNIILHIDHIIPIAAGGDNDISNLVTSCQSCNLGKGARQLSDSSVVKKQKRQLDELNERRIQMEMMVEWRNSLNDLLEQQIDAIEKPLKDKTGYSFNEHGRIELAKSIKKIGFSYLLEAAHTCANQYLEPDEEGGYKTASIDKAFSMIDRVAYVQKQKQENPEVSELYYIRGILKNRFSGWYQNLEWQTIDWLKHALSEGVSIDALKNIAKQSKNWTHFRKLINQEIAGL